MSRILAVDYGTRRVGLAISDPLRLTAQPLDVVPRNRAVEEISRIVTEHNVSTILVGLPTSLSGVEGASAEEARSLAGELEAATGAVVVMADERFTTKMAEERLRGMGVKRRDRRRGVDKVAAAILLQEYLDRLR